MTRTDDDPLLITTKSGALRGAMDENGVRVWRGVPYAAPVSRTGLYRAAQPAASWDGVRDARAFGPVSPQGRSGDPATDPPMSVDCHVVNVWSPTGARDLPVMVWIHGGAYSSGAGSAPGYRGQRLARKGPVVVVSLNYRLGPIGFLDWSSLPGAQGRFQTNVGLRDQILALAWVRDHVAAFGGDPGNVTIFGQSAGGGGVVSLLTSPLARGLFHAAIAQSPPAAAYYSRDQARVVAQTFLQALERPQASFDEVLALAPERLIEIGREITTPIADLMPSNHPFQPVIDGEVLTDAPLAAMEGGSVNAVPLMIGSTEDEGSLFANPQLPPLIPAREPNTSRFLAQHYPDRQDRIRAAYTCHGRFTPEVAIGGDGMVTIPVVRAAQAMSTRAPVHVYRLRWTDETLMKKGLGTPHSLDNAFVVAQFPPGGLLEPTPATQARITALSDTMQHLWTRFARDHEPDTGGPAWPAYDTRTRQVLILDDDLSVVSDPDAAQRASWGY